MSDFTAEKSAPAPTPAADAVREKPRGQTLRLGISAWQQLKMLAVERQTTSHSLLIEAVNDLFRKHGRPPIA
ncbi:MAG: ribbon-helix-helix domain-containing protein [Acetobacteraceae bacterium]